MLNEKRANIYILRLIFRDTVHACTMLILNAHIMTTYTRILCRKTEKVRYPTSSLSTLLCNAFTRVILIATPNFQDSVSHFNNGNRSTLMYIHSLLISPRAHSVSNNIVRTLMEFRLCHHRHSAGPS